MKMICILLSLALPGCAGIGTVEKDIATEGAAAADNVRDVAQWTLCKGISVGAWVRAYGDSADKANAWKTLCNTTVQQTPAK